MVWNFSLSPPLLLHIPIKPPPHAKLLCTVYLSWIDRLVLRPMRKTRDRALAVWTRAVPEERIDHETEVEAGTADVNAAGLNFVS
jgi:hypothetical protein